MGWGQPVSTAVVSAAPVPLAWGMPEPTLAKWEALHAALDRLTSAPLCAIEPDLWFEAPSSPWVAEAVAACLRCPVLTECRDYALAADERAGVWGATTEADRRALTGRQR